jgi:hypothetical protein
MTVLGSIGRAFGSIRPLELSLVVMNCVLVALLWNQFHLVVNLRSVNFERYVAADLEIDKVLANCIAEDRR